MSQTLDRFAPGGRRLALVPVLVLVLLAGCATTRQDPLTTRKVLDNEEVLVVETTYRKNGSAPMHTHLWPHVVYVIDGGTLQTTAADGTVSTVELRAGQTLWRNAQTYSTRNIGSTTVRIVEVAIKNASTAPRPAEVSPLR